MMSVLASFCARARKTLSKLHSSGFSAAILSRPSLCASSSVLPDFLMSSAVYDQVGGSIGRGGPIEAHSTNEDYAICRDTRLTISGVHVQ